MKNIPGKADDKSASSGLNIGNTVPDAELDIQEEGLNLVERTFASAYRKSDEIDPDEEAHALALVSKRIELAEGRQLNGHTLIEQVREEGCILSPKDLARVLHRAWKNNFIHRKSVPEMVGTKRTGFIYWIDETNRPLELIEIEADPEKSFENTESKGLERNGEMKVAVVDPRDEVEMVHWLSSDGRKMPFSGQKIADIPAGESAYAHLEGVPRGLYARNFKDVASFDRVLVHSLEKGRYYAPAAHVVNPSLENPPQTIEVGFMDTLSRDEENKAIPAVSEDAHLPESKKDEGSGSVQENGAVSAPALEDSFLASYAAAQAWSLRTGQPWPVAFMTSLIEQAAREASQVRIEREHHRAVRRIVLAQTELMRAAILIDESASFQETLDF